MADTATTPSWWAWVARHRKQVAVIAGVVVVALVAIVVVARVSADDPKDVVQDYLDAIHSGDTRAALEIAGQPDAGKDAPFLSAAALADDWTIEAVVERHRQDDEADVDVTLGTKGASAQGRFHMVSGDDGWTIESPFVQVNLQAAILDVVELGKVRRTAQRAADAGPGTASVLVFPGVYDLYPSLAKEVAFEPKKLIAVPQESKDAKLRFASSYTVTDKGADAAQREIDARIDDCAKKTEISPTGCPFNGKNNRAIDRLTDVGDITWTVTKYPETKFVPREDGRIALVVRKPGTLTLTGTGVPEGSPRTTFALTCEFGLDNLTVALTMDGFTATTERGDPYSAALATICF